MLDSGIFNRAPNLAHVLTYVCSQYFEGAAEQIKEYNIAVEALRRPPGFDQKRDSIVRVEAHRLRKRLREYYEAEGASHLVRIDIPPGQYVPHFVRQRPPQPVLGEAVAAERAPSKIGEVVDRSAEPAQVHAETQAIAPLPNPISFSPSKPLLLAPPVKGHAAGTGTWAALALAIVGVTGAFLWKAPAAKTGKATPAVAGSVPVATQEVRILAGLQSGDYTDRFGRIWQSDRYFQGGAIFESSGHIAAARDPRLFRSRREGAFTYDIPLPPGVYELRLYFAETLYGETNMAGGGETSRIFAISANGAAILDDFDVIGEVGGSTADIRAFKDVSPAADGKLHLKFEPKTNPAMVSAIEITPGIRGKLRPIRLVSREHPYTDKWGHTWAADGYSRGGQLVMRTEPVLNIDDAELLRGERFGNLSYVIPVPAGRYGVTLYFSEAWFGPGNFAGGGMGSRIFDILCNGVAIRRGFDIFKEAHGSNRAVVLPLHGLEPDAQGKLNLWLVPVRNYALLNALEVVDESK